MNRVTVMVLRRALYAALVVGALASVCHSAHAQTGFCGRGRDCDVNSLTIRGSGEVTLRDAGVAAGRPASTPYCGDGGTALGWNGNAFTCTPVGSASASWQTALSCDTVAEGAQTLSSDTTYTICGFTFTKRNSAGDSSAMTVGGANGLKGTPIQSTDVWDTTLTAPMITVPLTSLIPSLSFSTPLRISAYYSGNYTANYDQTDIGVWVTGAPTNYAFLKSSCGAPLSGGNYTCSVANGSTASVGIQLTSQPNVMVLTLPGGIAGNTGFLSVGTWSSGYPAESAMIPIGNVGANDPAWNAIAAPKAFGANGGSLNSYLLMVVPALRAGSGTSLVGKVLHFKVEYKL